MLNFLRIEDLKVQWMKTSCHMSADPSADEDNAPKKANMWTLSWDCSVKLPFPSSRINFDA